MKQTALLMFAALVLASTAAYADCGKAHEKSDPHNMGRISTISFEDLDQDKSGGISFEEFQAVFPRTTEKGFAMLDSDGDNKLSKEEWQAFKDAHKGGMGHYKSTT